MLTLPFFSPASSRTFLASSSLIPVTSGIVAGSLPLETTSETFSACLMTFPALGSQEMTLPDSTLAEYSSVTSPGVRPAAVIAAVAWSLVFPTTSGTVLVSTPRETVAVTAWPSPTFWPAFGWQETMLPAGTVSE